MNSAVQYWPHDEDGYYIDGAPIVTSGLVAEHWERDAIARVVHRAWCCTELYGVPDGHAISDEDNAITDAVLAHLVRAD